MSVYSLWIINKAGGLVYNKTLNRSSSIIPLPALLVHCPAFRLTNLPLSSHHTSPAGLPQLSQNEALVMAGTLHGIHAITGKLSPVDGRGEGVEVIEGEGVKMIVFLTGTG